MTNMADLNDPFGLLESSLGDQNSTRLLPPLLSRLSEFRDFVEQCCVLPDSEGSLYARQLRQWFEHVRGRDDLLKFMSEHGAGAVFQKFEMMAEPKRGSSTLVDPFGLLGGVRPTGVQNIRNVSKVVRAKPEKIARRVPCPNFETYEALFQGLDERIQAGQLVPHTNPSGKLHAGMFVIVQDLFGYLAEVDTNIQQYKYSSGERQREDGRTLVVFENGTQSEMLLRSLEKAVLSDGYYLEPREGGRIEDDVDFGFLYVVQSARELDGLNGAFKIGFTRSSVEKRIAKAKTEAAYLFGDVNIVATYRCIGVDPAALEAALHSFFRNARLDIEVNLGSGTALTPKEWFRVPLEDINRAVFLALDSELQLHEYQLDSGIRRRAT